MSAGTSRSRASPGAFLLSAVVAATIFTAEAEACRKFEDKRHLLAFGRFELGDDRSRLPADIEKEEGCSEDAGNNAYDCSYLDTDGVSYLFYGHDVVRKDIRDLAQYSGPALIAGIEASDTISVVLRKLRSLPDDFPDWQAYAGAGEDDHNVYLSPAACLVTAEGGDWYYELIFDKDSRLTGITAMFESVL
jgi:hypothetical protein